MGPVDKEEMDQAEGETIVWPPQSREKKFRVWDKDLCKYVTGAEFEAAKICIKPDEDNGQIFTFDTLFPGRYKFEQFTGFYDENGRPIYEGDLITNNYDEAGEVVMIGSQWRMVLEDFVGVSRNLGEVADLPRLQVIGTIHKFDRPVGGR